jgi:eukaryotic-like serine/threonine-protein kinase
MMLGVGEVVDRYRVDARVSDAEVAEVYRVTHSWLGSSHALKLLNVQANDGLREALLAEGRTMAGLGHPNLVRVTDALAIHGMPALVMDWVDGPALADWLADLEGMLPVPTVVALLDGILAGVGHAHRAGVIHRDLKPENVLLARTPEGLVPRVADFGMAKVRNQRGLSVLYARFGTPEYMAPETISDTGRADHRADLFALGVILYELLTRRLPFDGDNPAVVMKAVLSGKYIDPLVLRPDLPAGVVAMVHALLAPDREQRPATCREVRTALIPYR